MLQDWLARTKTTYSDFGRKLGRGHETVRRYALKRRIPRPDEMAEIYRLTAGEIDPNSFFELPELPPEHALARAAMLEAEAAELRRRATAAGCVA